jgi:hypothetical protein
MTDMRIPILLSCLGASALALAAHAQETQAPPPADQPMTQTPPAPSDMPAPVDNGTAVPPATSPAPDASMPPPPPPPPSAYNAAPTAAPPAAGPPQVVMGPPQPMVQATPAPPAEYPVCSREVKDACRNPGEGGKSPI